MFTQPILQAPMGASHPPRTAYRFHQWVLSLPKRLIWLSLVALCDLRLSSVCDGKSCICVLSVPACHRVSPQAAPRWRDGAQLVRWCPQTVITKPLVALAGPL